MKNLPLDYYKNWPFARKAKIFLNAAKTSYEPTNRQVGSWEASYYLLSHAVELAIKAVAQLKTDKEPPKTHDKQELSSLYQVECEFTKCEMETIQKLKELNNGRGGLRYENEVIGDPLPSTFNEGILLCHRLLEYFE